MNNKSSFIVIIWNEQKIELEFPDLVTDHSPTKRVGGDITKKFDTVIHNYPMLSLANSYSKEDHHKHLENNLLDLFT